MAYNLVILSLGVFWYFFGRCWNGSSISCKQKCYSFSDTILYTQFHYAQDSVQAMLDGIIIVNRLIYEHDAHISKTKAQILPNFPERIYIYFAKQWMGIGYAISLFNLSWLCLQQFAPCHFIYLWKNIKKKKKIPLSKDSHRRSHFHAVTSVLFMFFLHSTYQKILLKI